MAAILSVDTLLEEARSRTGLDDFGPEDYLEGLNALVTGINTDADVRADRQEMLRERLLRLLMNRLWFARDLSQNPEILDEDLGTPTVISSLPRTASTKLHRMLGASGSFQTPLLWHVHMFARIPGEVDGGKAKRIAQTRAYEQWIYEVSPAMLTGHPVFTLEPEEDMMLSEATFRQPFIGGYLASDSYMQWLMQADMTPMYDYLVMQLKYLQWQNRGHGRRPWLLKTPLYFGNEEWLLKALGKLRLVVTHRDPAKAIPSIASTTLGWRALYADAPDSIKTGSSMVDMFAAAAQQHIQWREKHPHVPVLDLGFDEVTGDGMAAVEKVYQFLDLPLQSEARQAMESWQRANSAGKHGQHRYQAADMGLSETEIHQVFAAYIQRFGQWL